MVRDFVSLWCDLSSELAWFLDSNLTFSPQCILFLKTRVRQTSDPLFVWTSLPLNTFAWGYQQPLLWSWICCKTGSNSSVEQVPQHAVYLGEKILFKILFGQYFDSMALGRMRRDAFCYFCVVIEEHTYSLYMICAACNGKMALWLFIFKWLCPFLTFLDLDESV